MSAILHVVADLEIPGYEDDEVLFIERAVAEHRPEFIGEWGTNRGSSARILYAATRLHCVHGMIFTVELPVGLRELSREHPGEEVGEFVRDLPVIQKFGDGATEALWLYVSSGRPRALFFVDGDHTICNVFRELSSIRKVAPEAVILLHDTNSTPGIAIDRFLEQHPDSYIRESINAGAGMTKLIPR